MSEVVTVTETGGVVTVTEATDFDVTISDDAQAVVVTVASQGPQGIPGSSLLPDATSSVKGAIQLTGDLGGTAASPTVPALATKQDKEPGKGLSTNDYTTPEKTKLAGLVSDRNYEQAFTSASSVTVTHNLGKKPAVTVIDSAGDEVQGDINHVSTNQLTLSFSAAFSGIVIVN